MIPTGLLVHVATVEPYADGVFGTPFDLPGYFEQRVPNRQRDPEGAPAEAEAMFYADPPTPTTEVAPGSRMTINGFGASVLAVENFDDGGVSGLAHREMALRVWSLA